MKSLILWLLPVLCLDCTSLAAPKDLPESDCPALRDCDKRIDAWEECQACSQETLARIVIECRAKVRVELPEDPLIEILKSLLGLVTSHPEIVPALGRLVSNVSSAPDKQAAMRAAEAAAAKVAIRA